MTKMETLQAKNKYTDTYLFWGLFDSKNNKHMQILSLCIQFGWTKNHPVRAKVIADIVKLGEWLQSVRSPVRKPLKKMNPKELSKIISALEQMVNKKYG